MNKGKTFIRQVFWTLEFDNFYKSLSERVKTKFDYVLNVIETERVISTKFVKRLENTAFYEMRVSVGNNEYRTVIFTMDNENVILAKEITLLNAFLKKSTKDYHKQIKLAENILKRISYDEDRQE